MAAAMLLALSLCPAILGTQEAIRQGQAKNKREEHRARRCNLVVSCVKPSIRNKEIDGTLITLRDSKLYLDTRHDRSEEGQGHRFAGYYLPYPDTGYEGLVSTISDDPPMLNWIYVDRDTYEVKYGVRSDAQQHITGPFDCTQQDRRMTLEGWEGFVAVEEFPGTWALYFDRDDDGLVTKVPMGTRVLEVDLYRREKRTAKPVPEEEPMTLDDKMRELKSQDQEVQLMPEEGEGAGTNASGAADANAHEDVNTVATAASVTTEDDASDWPSSEKGSSDYGEGETVVSSTSYADEPPTEEYGAVRRATIYKSPYVEDSSHDSP